MSQINEKWPTTGEVYKELSEKNIYINGDVNDFLNSDRIFFVISSKGVGKTLLLRYKKYKSVLNLQEGIIIIPQNESIDLPTFPPDTKRDIKIRLTDRKFWEEIWMLSITVSILSHFNLHNLGENEKKDLLQFITSIGEDFDSFRYLSENISGKRRSVNPSDVLFDLLRLPLRKLDIFKNNKKAFIQKLFKDYVKSGVYIFIDGLDQALADELPLGSREWVSGQIGLMTAAYEMNRKNPHIKVFISIRQEAYADFRDDRRMAMESSTLMLNYKHHELKEMFEKLVNYYENKESIEDFIGLKVIHNTRVKSFTENTFKYILRHTNATPRSLSVLGNAISKEVNSPNRSSRREDAIREIVNVKARDIIVSDYLKSEMLPFLHEINDDDSLQTFLRLINKNILTHENMLAINRNYCSLFNKNVEDSHPFSDLYNIGLIGTLVKNEKGRLIQKFKEPHEFEWNKGNLITKTSYYFLHPALNQYMLDLNPEYCINQQIVIGNGYEWKEEYNRFLMDEVVKLFISYSSKDLEIVHGLAEKLMHNLHNKCIYARCFLDRWSLAGGEKFQEKIDMAVKDCNFLILMISRESLISNWVNREWTEKVQEEIHTGKIKVIGLVIDDIPFSNIPKTLQEKNCIRIQSPPTEKNIHEIVKSIILHAQCS